MPTAKPVSLIDVVTWEGRKFVSIDDMQELVTVEKQKMEEFIDERGMAEYNKGQLTIFMYMFNILRELRSNAATCTVNIPDQCSGDAVAG